MFTFYTVVLPQIKRGPKPKLYLARSHKDAEKYNGYKSSGFLCDFVVLVSKANE